MQSTFTCWFRVVQSEQCTLFCSFLSHDVAKWRIGIRKFIKSALDQIQTGIKDLLTSKIYAWWSHLFLTPAKEIRWSNFTSPPEVLLFSPPPLWFFSTPSLGWNPVNLTYDRPLLSACRKWKPGQPDDWGHGHEVGEDCAGLIHEGLWNDFFCEDLISYICEKEMETCTSISVFPNVNDWIRRMWFPLLMSFCILSLQRGRLDRRSDVSGKEKKKGACKWSS